MKQITKYILFTIFIFFSFTIYAKAEVTMCEYKLPYLGININSDTVVSKSEKVENSYFTVKYQKTNDDFILNYTNYKGGSPYKLELTKKMYNYINDNNKCPDYINVYNDTFESNTKFTEAFVSVPGIVIKYVFGDTITEVVPSSEKDFLTNIKINSGNGSNIPTVNFSPGKFVIPLYQSTIDGKNIFSSATQKKYIENTLPSWYSHMESKNSNAISSCGSKWSYYKNYGNYTSEFPTIDQFIDYATNNSYPNISLSKNDKDIVSSCFFARSSYMNDIYSLSMYIKSVGDDSKIKQLINSKYSDEFDSLNEYVKLAGMSSESQKASGKLENAYDRQNELLNNKCSVYCLDLPAQAKSECEKSSVYQKCYSCYYTNNKCSSMTNEQAKTECEKSVDFKGCIGEEEYNNLQNMYSEALSGAQDIIKEKINELTRINPPTLAGITFEPYKAKCSDFSILHQFWNIITIAAPIITIAFGVLDYSMAVIASNEEKMKKAKQKFPKRLLAVVLLILIPIIIRLILGVFSGTNDEKLENASNTSILKCIINGE